MNSPRVANLITFCCVILSVGVLLYGFPYSNIWTLFTGMLLWLMSVANAKITELRKLKDE